MGQLNQEGGYYRQPNSSPSALASSFFVELLRPLHAPLPLISLSAFLIPHLSLVSRPDPLSLYRAHAMRGNVHWRQWAIGDCATALPPNPVLRCGAPLVFTVLMVAASPAAAPFPREPGAPLLL